MAKLEVSCSGDHRGDVAALSGAVVGAVPGGPIAPTAGKAQGSLGQAGEVRESASALESAVH